MSKAFLLILVLWPAGIASETPVTVYQTEDACREDAIAIGRTRASVTARCYAIGFVPR